MKIKEEKIKFPLEIKGDLQLPEFEINDPFQCNFVIKERIDRSVNEVVPVKRKKIKKGSSSELL